MSDGHDIVQRDFPASISGRVVNICQIRNVMKRWNLKNKQTVESIWPGKVFTSLDIECADDLLFKEVPIDSDCDCTHLQNGNFVGLKYMEESSSYDIVDCEGDRNG